MDGTDELFTLPALMTRHPNMPLVSVVLTTYNHAQYLNDSLNSVLEQTYSPIEIIVVDDGSTDATWDVVAGYPTVHYHYQDNRGLAAARNTGIGLARGDYLLFLDADDALLPDAVSIQVEEMQRHPEAAFVSGGHFTADEVLRPLREVSADVQANHYETLLSRNYIGMHAAVMYRRSVLEAFCFDTGLTACEDYDLYLRIASRYPVHSHTRAIALYRTLKNGMSGNLPNMLQMALKALAQQQAQLNSGERERAYRQGRENWKNLYGYMMAEQLEKGMAGKRKQDYIDALLRNKPKLLIRYYLKKILPLSKT